jgi:hypothetical protein
MSREVFHTVPFATFRRMLITHRVAPKSAGEPFIWLADRPAPEMRTDEVCVGFDLDAIAGQLVKRIRGGYRTKEPHKPFVFSPEHITRALVKAEELVPGVQAMTPDVKIQPIGRERATILGDAESLPGVQWVAPSVKEELPELTRVARAEGIPLRLFIELTLRAELKVLDDAHWSELENTESFETTSMEQAKKLAGAYGNDLDRVVAGLHSGAQIPAPIVLERANGTLTLVAGNTRLMACRALGIRPRVALVWLDGAENDHDSDDLEAEGRDEKDLPAIGHPAAHPATLGPGKGKGDIGPPNFFRYEPTSRKPTIAKTDKTGYHGQHTPPGASVKIEDR